MTDTRDPSDGLARSNTSASKLRRLDDISSSNHGNDFLELSSLQSQGPSPDQRDAVTDKGADNALPTTIRLDSTPIARDITQTEKSDHVRDHSSEFHSEPVVYPSRVDLVVITIALMSSIFMIALDTNIIGRLNTIFSQGHTYSICRHRYPENNDPVQQPPRCWLVWIRLPFNPNGFATYLWKAVYVFQYQNHFSSRSSTL